MNGNSRNVNELGNALLESLVLEPIRHRWHVVRAANLGLLGQGEHLGGRDGVYEYVRIQSFNCRAISADVTGRGRVGGCVTWMIASLFSQKFRRCNFAVEEEIWRRSWPAHSRQILTSVHPRPKKLLAPQASNTIDETAFNTLAEGVAFLLDFSQSPNCPLHIDNYPQYRQDGAKQTLVSQALHHSEDPTTR